MKLLQSTRLLLLFLAPTLAEAGAAPIPAITTLPDGAVVPRTVFLEHDPADIGESLVLRHHLRYEATQPRDRPSLIDYQNGTAIQLLFQEKHLDSIAERGFLNQHQIGSSGGMYDPAERAAQEDHLLGITLEAEYGRGSENPANQVRPKYAFLSLKDIPLAQHPMIVSNAGLINSMYGNVFAVFSDAIKARTTFTMNDSLGMEKPAEVYTLRRKVLSADDPATHANGYMEAQVWGPLGMRDVHHFIVNCEGFRPIGAEALAKLRRLGKPVYGCEVDMRHVQGNPRGIPVRVREGALFE